MASPVEKSVQKAKDELDKVKQEDGVTVNIPGQGVEKTVNSIEEDMVYEGEEKAAEMEEPDTDITGNEISTGIDALLDYLKERDEASISTTSKDLDVSKDRIRDWAEALEKRKLLEQKFSATKGTILVYAGKESGENIEEMVPGDSEAEPVDELEKLENEISEKIPDETESPDEIEEDGSSGSVFSWLKSKLGMSDKTGELDETAEEDENLPREDSPVNEAAREDLDLDSDIHTETPVPETAETEDDSEELLEEVIDEGLDELEEEIEPENVEEQEEPDTAEDQDEPEPEMHRSEITGNNLEGEIIQESMGLPEDASTVDTAEPAEDRGAGSIDPAPEEDPDTGSVERRLKDLEEKIVEDRAGQIELEELESWVEQLESHQGIEERIERLEDKVESLKSPKELDDRMTELEDALMKPENHLENLVDEGMSKEINELEKSDSKLEAEVERISRQQEELVETVDELKDAVEEFRDREDLGELDDKVETLWEAFDREFAGIEDRIHDNEEEVEELLSQLVELSELVKQAMHQ